MKNRLSNLQISESGAGVIRIDMGEQSVTFALTTNLERAVWRAMSAAFSILFANKA